MSCVDCFKGAIHPQHEPPKGTMQTMHGYPCYIASAPPSSSSSSTTTTTTTTKPQSTIIFFCDAFGPSLVNNKNLCDRYAASTGFRVIAPDIIPGGAAPVSTMADIESLTAGPAVAWWDVWGQVTRALTFLRVVWVFLPFLIKSSPASGRSVCLAFARKVRAEMEEGAKLGVAGFCWGGYSSTALCAEAAVEGGQRRLVDAQFCGHPSGLKTPGMVVDAVKRFGTPYSMAIGDRDIVLREKKVLEVEAVLRREVGSPEETDYEIRIYKGCGHGFTVRSLPSNQVEMEAMAEATEQATNWFKKYL